jgi:hypothetical protein
VAPPAKWALYQLSVMRRNGATNHEITHEFNRRVYGEDSCPDCETARTAA